MRAHCLHTSGSTMNLRVSTLLFVDVWGSVTTTLCASCSRGLTNIKATPGKGEGVRSLPVNEGYTAKDLR